MPRARTRGPGRTRRTDEPADGCTACEQRRCSEMFTCRVCGRRLPKCDHLVGGLDAADPLCDRCWETAEFGQEWVGLVERREHNRLDELIDRLAELAHRHYEVASDAQVSSRAAALHGDGLRSSEQV